jgi:small neutral amino acid transporter SnatA (MarC family)
MKYNLNEIILFFTASLFATLIAEALISIYAFKVKRLIDPQKINIFNKFAGLFFIFIALRMLWRQFSYFIE